MLWPAVHAIRIEFEPELGGDHDLVADESQGFADKLLVCKWSISLSGIKEGHAAFHGCADQ